MTSPHRYDTQDTGCRVVYTHVVHMQYCGPQAYNIVAATI